MWDWIGHLEAERRSGRPFALVTVVGCAGSTPRELGARMLVRADGTFVGTIGGGQLEHLVLDDARRALAEGRARRLRYPLGPKAGQCCGGMMEILMEPIGAGPRLYLFGGGHVAQALCQVLADTPFTVELIEERDEWREAAGLSSSVVRHDIPWEDFLAKATFSQVQTYVAVMTHRHDLDQEIVQAVLRKPARFVGLIGSEPKWRRFKMRLRERGLSEAELSRVQCPIGLPTGGKSPKEVAISIAAQLLQTYHQGQPPEGEDEEATAPRS